MENSETSEFRRRIIKAAIRGAMIVGGGMLGWWVLAFFINAGGPFYAGMFILGFCGLIAKMIGISDQTVGDALMSVIHGSMNGIPLMMPFSIAVSALAGAGAFTVGSWIRNARPSQSERNVWLWSLFGLIVLYSVVNALVRR